MFRVNVSIIVPCYKQAQYLDECLQSVMDQTYPYWECIIVNDGSPDTTDYVAKNWLKKDSRFIYLKKENGGVASARNFGIFHSKGEWILPLDGDDKIGKDYLFLASQQFDKNPHIIYCKGEYFGTISYKMIMNNFTQEDILLENPIFCSSFFKKETWEKIKGYDENMLDGYEDWEFWISMYSYYNHLTTIMLDYTGFSYRIKEISRNTEAVKVHDKKIREYIFKKHSDLYCKNIHNFSNYFKDLKHYKKENILLREKLSAKRYQCIDKILSIFNL